MLSILLGFSIADTLSIVTESKRTEEEASISLIKFKKQSLKNPFEDVKTN